MRHGFKTPAFKIFTFKTFACLAGAIALPATTEAADDRATLLRDFGLDLVAASQEEAWAPAEIQAIQELLEHLPKDLSRVAKSSGLGRIKVFKTRRPAAEETHAAPLPILHWQMILDLGADYRFDGRTFDRRPLWRRLVHHLLHVYDGIHGTSRRKAWRALSGWHYREYLGLRLPLVKEAANQDLRGYGSAEGLISPAADFAAFGERFFVPEDSLIEDALVCRVPDKYAFFVSLFGADASPLTSYESACRPVDEGFLDDLAFFDPITRVKIPMGPVNAETVDGFELLYATPGVQDAAEVAGHLVLRIRLKNNPWAETAGLENPHDLVVSFLADTDAGKPAKAPSPRPKATCETSWLGVQRTGDVDAFRSVTQALKGLSGGFLTTFDRQTLAQTVRSYTVDQDRNLLRYRLNLTVAQKTRLIDRLYAAKKNFKTKYYFFDRNCASVLVQVIGEGIEDAEVAAFDPMVVPPNALVALLLRKGLASPIHPAFYGYRKRAHVAQEIMRARLAELALKVGDTRFPKAQDLFAQDERRRAKAYAAFGDVLKARPDLAGEIFQLAALGQEADMAFTEKDAACESYASRPVETMRELQTRIIDRDETIPVRYATDVNRLVADHGAPLDASKDRRGSAHTNLSSVYLGAGLRVDDRTRPVTVLGTTLHKQDLGAHSSQSMQRATAVTLGDLRVAFGENGDLESWHATGLTLRKLKERLDRVPSYATADGSLGLGLTVLDLAGASGARAARGTVAGGELLANLVSSGLYEDYLLVAVGGAFDIRERPDGHGSRRGEDLSLAFPLRAEGLLTFGADRAWQLRAGGEVRYTLFEAGLATRRDLATLSLVHRLMEPRGTELLLRFDGAFERRPELSSKPKSSLQLGLEWNRW